MKAQDEAAAANQSAKVAKQGEKETKKVLGDGTKNAQALAKKKEQDKKQQSQ